MRPCPFCGQTIQDEAIVCRHCGLDVQPPEWLVGKVRCAYCAEWIDPGQAVCPYCKSDLSEPPPERAAPASPGRLAPSLSEAEERLRATRLDETAESPLSPRFDRLRTLVAERLLPALRRVPVGKRVLALIILAPVVVGGAVYLARVVHLPELPALPDLPDLRELIVGASETPAASPAPSPEAVAAALTPTPRARPTATPLAPTPTPGCRSWEEVSLEDDGQELCVYGQVKRWYRTGELPFVAVFSEEPGTFIVIDRSTSHEGVEPGTCIQVTGTVEVMGGARPYIDAAGQLEACP